MRPVDRYWFRVAGLDRNLEFDFYQVYFDADEKSYASKIEIKDNRRLLCSYVPYVGSLVVEHAHASDRPNARIPHPEVFVRNGRAYLFVDSHPGAGSAGQLEMYLVGSQGRSLTHIRTFMNGVADDFGNRGLVREFEYSKYMTETLAPWARFYVHYW